VFNLAVVSSILTTKLSIDYVAVIFAQEDHVPEVVDFL
jgi:hypothetical protein